VQDALGNTIYNIMTQTKTGSDILRNLFRGFTQIISQMAAKSIMGMAKTGLESLTGGGGIGGIFGGLFSGLFGGLFGSTSSAVGGFTASMGGVMNLPSLMGDGAVLPGGFTPLARIPQFAGGGVFDRPTLGIIGERGPEAVVPLDEYDRGGGNYQISVAHSPIYNYRPTADDYKRDARMIVGALDKELRGLAKRSTRNFVK